MVTKVLVIDVKDNEVDELNKKLQSTGANLEKVEGASGKVNNELTDLRDNGGAIATLDSFTGGAATKMKDLAEATDLFNGKLRVTRGALIATGIGAFVVLVGLLIEYWDQIVELFDKANEKLERQVRLSQRLRDVYSAELEILENQEALLEAQGEMTEEVRKKRIEILQSLIKESELQLKNLEIQEAQLEKESLRVTLMDRVRAAISGTPPLPTISEEEAERIKGLQDRILELRKTIPSLKLDLIDLQNPSDDSRETTAPRTEQEQVILPLSGLSPEALKSNLELEATILKDADKLITDSQLRFAEERRQARVKELEAKDELIQAEAQLLGQFSQLLSIFGEENKALAIAAIVAEQVASASQIVSATGVANAKAIAASPLTGGQPWVAINTASAALSIATGLAAAGKAISDLGGGGSASGGFSVAGGDTTAPAFNIVDSSPENQLNASLLGDQGTKEVFVTEGKVRTAQEARRKKVSATSF